MGRNKRKIGEYAENAAVRYLRENGFIIHARNYRAFGFEIDILASKKYDGELNYHLVEVKRVRREHYLSGYPVLRASQMRNYRAVRERWYVREQAILPIHVSLLVLDGHNDVLDFFPFYA